MPTAAVLEALCPSVQNWLWPGVAHSQFLLPHRSHLFSIGVQINLIKHLQEPALFSSG